VILTLFSVKCLSVIRLFLAIFYSVSILLNFGLNFLFAQLSSYPTILVDNAVRIVLDLEEVKTLTTATQNKIKLKVTPSTGVSII